MPYFAHTKENDRGEVLPESLWHPLKDHLMSVGEAAGRFAEPMGMEREAYLAGLLHDFGKYGDNFQKRLHGQIRGVNHWAHGAELAYERKAFLAAFCIAGHHTGIPKRTDLSELIKDVGDPEYRDQKLRLHEDVSGLLKRADKDQLGIDRLPIIGNLEETKKLMLENPVAFGLRLRMLFSALVDADFLDTERFCNLEQSKVREEARCILEPARALEVLSQYLDSIQKKDDLGRLRKEFLDECLGAADPATWLYTLTGPTGIGKTLSSLAFALRHAAKHGKRRIIVVIPYTTIIEQTAGVYRNVFEKAFGPYYVLEHHSNYLPAGGGEEDSANPAIRRHRLLSENWDSPLIVTTSVQFFDSLFANRPRDCRKLHNIAHSVVFFDEVQTLPVGLLRPSLSALKSLTADFGCTCVLGTATQPAFGHLSSHVEKGWNPVEIIGNPKKYASALKRVEYRFDGEMMNGIGADRLAEKLLEGGSVLCVLNTKKGAEEIWRILRQKDISHPGADTEERPDFAQSQILHLSTTLCAGHRRQILDAARRRLDAGQRVVLVSTQLVEAGVDVDFPKVFRAFGPLDSIIQSAGRCNREGRLKGLGQVFVFKLKDHPYPRGVYKRAAEVTESLYQQSLLEGRPFEVEAPELLETYFKRLYQNSDIDSKEILDLARAEKLDFPGIAQRYRLIDDSTRAVLVPWDGGREVIEDLKKIGHWTRPLLEKAKAYSVNFYQQKFKECLAQGAIASTGENGEIAYWNLKYHPYLGAVMPGMEEMVV